MCDKIFHMQQVTAVRTQLKLDALGIPDMDHQLFEDAKPRRRMYRYQQTALHHQLQQPDGFHGHRFTAGIGTADHQDPAGFFKGN